MLGGNDITVMWIFSFFPDRERVSDAVAVPFA